MSRISLIITFWLVTVISLGQTTTPMLVIPNSTQITDNNGKTITRIVVPGSPPPKVYVAKSSSFSATAVKISNVPTLNWCYGCTATSAAMAAGYYDRNGYDNIYTGTTNGGIFPLTNDDWGYGECPLSATHIGVEGRVSRGHVEDYWTVYGSSADDPYITNSWSEHTPDCTADYMKTSRSAYNNNDGSTTLYFCTDGSPYSNTTEEDDGGYGFQLFLESKGYIVVNRFNQYILGHGSDPALGYTFANYKSEIDNNRPVFINLAGHTMLGMGYDDATQTIYIHDTWDHSEHQMTWGGSYSGMNHYGVTVIELQSATPTVSATISNNNYTYDGTTKSVTVTTTPLGLANTVTYFDQAANPVTNPTNAGTYNVVVTMTQAGYTSEGPFYGTLTIDKKTLSAVADNKTVNYGDPEPAYTINYGGFVSGESSANLTTVPIADITEPWPANPGSYVIYIGSGTDENYSFIYSNGTLTVNGLSVNGVTLTNATHSYDGNNKEITVTTDPPGISNTVVYLLGSQVIAAPTNANNYDVIITIDETGYNADQFNTTLTIEKAALTATADDKTVDYGDPEPSYTINYSGFILGEDESSLDTKPTADVAGLWPLAPGNYSIIVSGGNDDNYSLTNTNGTLTVSALLADSVKFENLTQSYNGITHAPTITTYPGNLAYTLTYFDALNNPITNTTNAGTYSVKVTISETGYDQDVFTAQLIIEKANLAITAKDTTVIYGEQEPVYTLSFIGFQNGENKTVLDELPSADIAENWPVLPGNYSIILTGGQDDNYSYTTISGTLIVSPAIVDSVQFSDLTTNYTGLAQYPTILVYPDTVDYTTVYTDANSQVVVNPINAGNYGITVTITETGFSPDAFNQNMVIDKADLEVSAKDTSVVFGAPKPDFQIEYSGFVNGENEADLSTPPNANIEEIWPVYPGTYSIKASSGVDENYSFNYVDGTLTVEGLSASNVTISNNSYTYNGASKQVTVTTTPVGLGHTVSYHLNGLPINSPTNAGNYEVTVTINEPGYNADQFTSTLIINQAALTASANNQSTIYGETEPVYTISYLGFVVGEDINELDTPPLAEVGGSWPLVPGSYPIIVTGGADNNYSFITVNGELTVSPVRADSLKFSDLFYTYDATPHEATILIYPDTVDFVTTYSDSNYQLIPMPTDAGIYQIMTIVTESVYRADTFYQQLSIAKAEITATVEDATIDYGNNEPEYTILYEGFKANEDESVIDEEPTAIVYGTRPLLPGSYPIELTGGWDNNYTINTNNGTLTIESNGVAIALADTILIYNGLPREITVNTVPQGIQFEVTYFNETQAVINPPNLPGMYRAKITITEPGYDQIIKTTSFVIKKAKLTVSVQNETINFGEPLPEFSYSISGFVNGENETVLAGMPSLSLDGTPPYMPGNYAINVAGGVANNYDFTYNQGTLTILPLNVQSIIITDTTTIYNGKIQQIKVTTLPSGLEFSINYFDLKGLPVEAPVSAGRYVYLVSISATGYAEKIVSGQFVIKSAPLTIGISAIEVTYGDNKPEPVIYYTGFVEGETQNVLSELPTAGAINEWPLNVGTYPLTVSGGAALNYTIDYQQGELVVQPKTLTIKPDDLTISYNDAIPEFTYSVTGFVFDEDASVLLTKPQIQTQEINPKQPGSYLLVANGASALNYSFVYNTGVLRIEPIGNVEIIISDTIATYTGLTHQVAVTTVPAEISYLLEYSHTPIDAGTYGVMVTINEPGYTPIISIGSLQISKAVLIATAHDKTMLMGDEIPEFTFDLTDFVNNETISVIDQLPISEIEEQLPINAGTYSIKLSGGNDNNYDFVYNHGTLNVIQTYTIKIIASENGSVALGENETKQDSVWERVVVNENSSYFYALPNDGYLFEKWDNESIDNPIRFNNVTSDIRLTAIFVSQTGVDFLSANDILFIPQPNPVAASQLIRVLVDLPDELYSTSTILVSDMLGRKIAEVKEVAAINQLQGLKQGIYNLSLFIDGKKYDYARLLVK